MKQLFKTARFLFVIVILLGIGIVSRFFSTKEGGDSIQSSKLNDFLITNTVHADTPPPPPPPPNDGGQGGGDCDGGGGGGCDGGGEGY